MKDFSGKVAFITGGASGGGFGQAQIFSEAGMKVVIADVRQDHIDRAAEHFKSKDAQVHFIKLDVMDKDGWIAAADETERVYGTPDLLIQTAGVNNFGPIEAQTYEDFDWVMGVNFLGLAYGLITWVPRMIKAGKGGHISATISLAAMTHSGTYAASKIGALNYMEGYYNALKPYGIEVSAMIPANINSNINDAMTKSRPEHLKKTGFNATAEIADFMYNSMQIHGLDPRELASRMKKGIEDGVFLIVPYPSGAKIFEEKQERWALYSTPEGMQELDRRGKMPQTEEQRRLELETEGYNRDIAANQEQRLKVGVGLATEDRDWVMESKRMK